MKEVNHMSTMSEFRARFETYNQFKGLWKRALIDETGECDSSTVAKIGRNGQVGFDDMGIWMIADHDRLFKQPMCFPWTSITSVVSMESNLLMISLNSSDVVTIDPLEKDEELLAACALREKLLK
ncbi:hypothetical protein BH10CYA1_BH10CYA1_23050 [soil metagenome]